MQGQLAIRSSNVVSDSFRDCGRPSVGSGVGHMLLAVLLLSVCKSLSCAYTSSCGGSGVLGAGGNGVWTLGGKVRLAFMNCIASF